MSKNARELDCANRRGMIRHKRTKEIYKNTKEVHKYKRKRIKVQKNKNTKEKSPGILRQGFLHEPRKLFNLAGIKLTVKECF